MNNKLAFYSVLLILLFCIGFAFETDFVIEFLKRVWAFLLLPWAGPVLALIAGFIGIWCYFTTKPNA